MLNWEELVTNAPKFVGVAGRSKTVYFGPDEAAPFGRYWDGVALSEHPDAEEINKYFEFYVALSSEEQREVLQGMFDTQLAIEFGKAYRGRPSVEIVEAAIKWWDRQYKWEVKEFMAYLAWKKGTLRDPKGYDATKAHKFKGSIPQRVKHFVMNANSDLVRHDGKDESPFEKIFYSIFTKALIGGN